MTPQSHPQPPPVLPVYEDFSPMIESVQEESSHVVLIHLPGFAKEQLRILVERRRRILHVYHKRLVAGNKCSRFQEEIPVPEDCQLAEIHAMFEHGILRITMPKTIPAAAPPSDDKPDQSPPSPPLPTLPSLRPEPFISPKPPPVLQPPQEPVASKKQAIQDETPPPTSKVEPIIPPKPHPEPPPMLQPPQESVTSETQATETETPPPAIPTGHQPIQSEQQRREKPVGSDKDQIETKVPPLSGQSPTDVPSLPSPLKIPQPRSPPAEDERTAAETGDGNGGADGRREDEEKRYHQPEDEGWGTATKKSGSGGNSRVRGNDRKMLNEDTQLLVNAVVAILVAISLGAYISYSSSSCKSNN